MVVRLKGKVERGKTEKGPTPMFFLKRFPQKCRSLMKPKTWRTVLIPAKVSPQPTIMSTRYKRPRKR